MPSIIVTTFAYYLSLTHPCSMHTSRLSKQCGHGRRHSYKFVSHLCNGLNGVNKSFGKLCKYYLITCNSCSSYVLIGQNTGQIIRNNGQKSVGCLFPTWICIDFNKESGTFVTGSQK